jgi:hypothetical protein
MPSTATINNFETAIVNDGGGEFAGDLLARLQAAQRSELWLSGSPLGAAHQRDVALGQAMEVVTTVWQAAHRVPLAWQGSGSTLAPEPSRLLHELADIAITALSVHMGEAFESIRAFFRPRLHSPSNFDVCHAMVFFARGEVEAARHMLVHDVLQQEPLHEPGRCALGFIQQCLGEPGWQDLYGSVLATSTNPTIRKTALSLLAQAPRLERAVGPDSHHL